MNWSTLLSLLVTLAGNKYMKSALISLAGVLGSLLTQTATGADLGTVGSAAAAGVSAWLANLLKELAPLLLAWIQSRLTSTTQPADDGVDLSQLDQLAPARPAQKPGVDDVPLSLLWLVPLLGLCCSLAQASPPKAVLVGPSSARPGVPIRFDASQSVGDIEHYILKVRPQSDDAPTIQYDIKSKEEGKPPVL